MGLGPLHTVTLAEARVRAHRARLSLLDDIDPLEARTEAKAKRARTATKAMTFETAARRYNDAQEIRWKNETHRRQFIASLQNHVFAKVGRLSVGDIDLGHVLSVLEPIWTTIPETAGRIRARIEAVLAWATVRGYRTATNPASWRDNLDKVLPPLSAVAKVEHHPALPFVEIGDFAAELRDQEGIAARALEWTILTAARTGETIGATWDEIDFGAKLWTIPAARMKAGRNQRVPLDDAALNLLASLPRDEGNAHIFIGGKRAPDSATWR